MPLSARRILVVAGAAVGTQAVTAARLLGYEAQVTEIAGALAMTRAYHPDIVMIDIDDASGPAAHDLARSLRQIRGGLLKILLLTDQVRAATTPEEFDGRVTKPVWALNLRDVLVS